MEFDFEQGSDNTYIYGSHTKDASLKICAYVDVKLKRDDASTSTSTNVRSGISVTKRLTFDCFRLLKNVLEINTNFNVIMNFNVYFIFILTNCYVNVFDN